MTVMVAEDGCGIGIDHRTWGRFRVYWTVTVKIASLKQDRLQPELNLSEWCEGNIAGQFSFHYIRGFTEVTFGFSHHEDALLFYLWVKE